MAAIPLHPACRPAYGRPEAECTPGDRAPSDGPWELGSLRSGGHWLLGELAHQAGNLHHAPIADELAVGNPVHLG